MVEIHNEVRKLGQMICEIANKILAMGPMISLLHLLTYLPKMPEYKPRKDLASVCRTIDSISSKLGSEI